MFPSVITTKVYFDNKIQNYHRLLTRAQTAIPEEYIKRYKKNVAPITPSKTNALRRSIITQASGGTANIGWRSAYAAAQNVGHHTVHSPVQGLNKRDGGYATIKPDKYYYVGTQTGFRKKAFQKTNRELPALMRELGLTR